MGELLQNLAGVLSLLAAFVFLWLLGLNWNSASPKRFQGIIASVVGFILFALGFFLDDGIFRVTGLLSMMFGGVMQERDRQEVNSLPKGTRVRRVVNSIKVLGIPVWRKVVSTEILPPEGQPNATH